MGPVRVLVSPVSLWNAPWAFTRSILPCARRSQLLVRGPSAAGHTETRRGDTGRPGTWRPGPAAPGEGATHSMSPPSPSHGSFVAVVREELVADGLGAKGLPDLRLGLALTFVFTTPLATLRIERIFSCPVWRASRLFRFCVGAKLLLQVLHPALLCVFTIQCASSLRCW